jgi:hypothetical protein
MTGTPSSRRASTSRSTSSRTEGRHGPPVVLAAAVEATLAPQRWPDFSSRGPAPGATDRQPGASPARIARRPLRASSRRGRRHEPTRCPRLRAPPPVVAALPSNTKFPPGSLEPASPARPVGQPSYAVERRQERYGRMIWGGCWLGITVPGERRPVDTRSLSIRPLPFSTRTDLSLGANPDRTSIRRDRISRRGCTRQR